MSRPAAPIKLLAIALAVLCAASACNAARPLSSTISSAALGSEEAFGKAMHRVQGDLAAAVDAAKAKATSDVETATTTATAAEQTIASAEDAAAAGAAAGAAAAADDHHARKLASWFGGGGGSSGAGGDADADAEEEGGGDGGEEGGDGGEGTEGEGGEGEGGEGGTDESDAAEDNAVAEMGESSESTSEEGDASESDSEGGGDEEPPSIEFESHDHTDLYTVKRDRDRAWEQAKKSGGRGGGGGDGGVKIHKSAPSARRSTGTGKNIEYGQWIQLGGAVHVEFS
jgi:hypothetical protein